MHGLPFAPRALDPSSLLRPGRIVLGGLLSIVLGAGLYAPASAQTADPDPKSDQPVADSALRIQELEDRVKDNPTDAKAYTQLGILYLDEGLYEQARDAFISALQAAPGEPGSHLNLGVALLRMERWEEARLPLQNFRSMTPNDAQGYVLVGRTYLGEGDVEKAREVWKEGVTVGEAMPLEDRLALLHEIQGSYMDEDETAEDVETGELMELARYLEDHETLLQGPDAKSLRETIEYAYQQSAREARDEGRRQDALDDYAHLRERGSDNRAAWIEPIEMYLESGDVRSARAIVDEARRRLPEDALAEFLRGRVAVKEGDLRQAAEAYRAAADKDPDFPGVYAALGEVLADLGDTGGAARALEQAVERGEGGAAASYNMGVVLNDNGRFREAIPHLKRAIDLDPRRKDAYRALGIAYRKSDQFSRAAQTYQSIVDRFGPESRDLYQLAFSQAKIGDHRDAARNYSTVVALEPDNRLAHYSLAQSLMQIEEYEKAAEHFQKALELQGDFHAASFSLALCYQKMGDYERASDQYERTLEIKESYASYVNLAICQKQLGNEELSNEYYRLADEIRKGGR